MITRSLHALMRLIVSYPWRTIIVVMVATALWGWYTITNLQFNMDRNALVSHDQEYNQRFERYEAEFADLEEPLIVIENYNLEQTKRLAADLCRRLKRQAKYVKSCTYKIDDQFFRQHFLLYMPYELLVTLHQKLQLYQQHLAALAQCHDLAAFYQYLADQMNLAAAARTSGQSPAVLQESLHFLELLLNSLRHWLKQPGEYCAPWQPFLTPSGLHDEKQGLLLSDNGKLLFLAIQIDNQHSDAAIAQIRQCLQQSRHLFPQTKCGLTGRPVLDYDEMQTTDRDMRSAALLSLAGVTILFIFAFHQFWLPLNAVFCLLVGIVWTFGVTTLFIGHLNLLSCVFAVILIGLGIDFSIHLIGRFAESLQQGDSVRLALEKSVAITGRGIITGALTTAAAFYTALLTDFRGIAELGFIAGTGVLLCLVITLSLLPAMLMVQGKTLQAKYQRLAVQRPVRIALISRVPLLMLILASIATLSALWVSLDLYYDHNLLHLQPLSLESVRYELKIINQSGKSNWFGAIQADSLAQARQKKKLLAHLPSVGSIESVLPLIPAQQEQKLQLLQQMRSLEFTQYVRTLSIAPTVRLTACRQALANIEAQLRSWEQKLQQGLGHKSWLDHLLENAGVSVHVIWRKLTAPRLRYYQIKIRRLRTMVSQINQQLVTPRAQLVHYQQHLLEDFQNKLRSFVQALDSQPITPAQLPEFFRRKFVGKTGKLRLLVFPEKNIWERQAMREFLEDLRSVDPQVTGAVVQVYESSRLMKEGYEKATLYAFIVIFIILLLDFRNLTAAFLSMLPLLVGGTWFLGLLAQWRIPLNPANIIALPLVLGIGIDSGVHLIHRYYENRQPTVMQSSTGWAITLSSLTTMIGFGALSVATHRGVASLGLTLTIGVGCCLLATWTILPALFALRHRQQTKTAKVERPFGRQCHNS